MKKKRLLVCGATGFIGRNLVEHFCGYEEWDVIGVYHKTPHFEFPNLKWVQADLTNHEDVNRVVPGHDVVVQAAAIPLEQTTLSCNPKDSLRQMP